jgi:hypothetical protein
MRVERTGTGSTTASDRHGASLALWAELVIAWRVLLATGGAQAIGILIAWQLELPQSTSFFLGAGSSAYELQFMVGASLGTPVGVLVGFMWQHASRIRSSRAFIRLLGLLAVHHLLCGIGMLWR